MPAQFSCDSFAQIEWFAYEQTLQGTLRQEIQNLAKDYILGVDEDSYKAHLVDRFTLDPLEILVDSERVTPRTEMRRFEDDFGRTGQREVYVLVVSYNFQGSASLFQVKSNPWSMTSHAISVDGDTVSFEFLMSRKDPDEFKKRKNTAFNESFANVGNINKNATEWNAALPPLVGSLFDFRKKHFSAENDFFTAINIAPDPGTSAIFTAPTIRRRVIPQPKVSEKTQFSRVPTMSDEMYEDVLTVLSQAGHGMERKPSLYRDKEEEDLRDQFLLFLETRYTATTGTGETFNKSGKTDILLKYQDGSNLFVAECKWWSGEADFHAAIEQLFARYLTWRDSKAALLLFVNNKSFSAVIEKVRNEAEKNAYFVRRIPDRGETSLSFDFHLPDDEARIVKLAILLFAFR
jgi:hypothetical protein